MSEIIRKWISDTLGIILDLDLLSFGDIAKDGNIIAQLLCYYGILNCDVLDILPKSENQQVCLANLNYLNKSLKSIGIDCSDKKLEALSHGEGTVAIKLFYQLYLILHNKNKLYFITNAQLKDEPHVGRRFSSEDKTNLKLSIANKPDLDGTKVLYKWHKNNYLDLLSKCKEAREKYIERFKTEIKQEIINIDATANDLSKKTDDKDFNKNDLSINSSDESCSKNIIDTKIYDCSPNQKQARIYSSKLKEKTRKSNETKLLQTYMQKMLLSDIFKKFSLQQEMEFNNTITNKLLKQSYYEKQMITKLLEIQNQKEILLENKRIENELYAERRNQVFVSELFQQEHNICLAKIQNMTERQRILDLHKKLYNEKQVRKYNRHYNICYDIVSDIADLAIKVAEYKNFYETDHIPEHFWHEWVSLFCINKKILDALDNIEDIIVDHEYLGEEAITAEIYRQNGLDDKDMSDYLNLEYPWSLEELENLYLSQCDVIQAGETVLGYIVHKLLLLKYPLPALPSAPELPRVFTACCIIGNKDDSLLTVLNRVLLKKHIILINLQEVINYCMQAYFKEEDDEVIEKALIVETNKAKQKLTGKKGIKAKDNNKKGRKSKTCRSKISGSIRHTKVNEETQTPKIFPCEEILLSKTAQLGQYAFQTLNLGNTLNGYYLSAMFVEYLKQFTTIKGWILVDFPENVQDAITLEQALTGSSVEGNTVHEDETESDDEGFKDEYYRNELFAVPEDIYVFKRVSKIVPNPVPITPQEKYKCYLTSFVRLIKDKAEQNKYNIDNFARVEEFYEQFHCSYQLTYDTFDANTVKELISLIAKDKIFAKSVYNDVIQTVFDVSEEIRKREEELTALASISKRKKSKSKKDKSKKEPKSARTSYTDDKKNVSILPPLIEETVEIIVYPGDPKWNYINLPQPLEYQLILAAYWEDIEEIFLNDMKQIFFQLRTFKNSIIPYGHIIKKYMKRFIERPDKKQHFLHKFQLTYNALENDLREDDEFRTEMHCRILQFKSKLWEMSTIRMRESETERAKIINEHWFYLLAVEYTNLFVSAIQIELDRNVSTCQFLQDYYTLFITQEPSSVKYNKTVLNLFKTDDKVQNFVSETFIDIPEELPKTPFSIYIDLILKNSLQFANSCYATAYSSAKNIEKDIAVVTDKKREKSKKLSIKPGAVEPGHIFDLKHTMERIAQEWQCGIDGELARIKFRLNLITAKAHKDINYLIEYGKDLFRDIYDCLQTRYQDEIASIDKACEIFHKATEACENIQPRLVLDGSKFYIDKTDILETVDIKPSHPFKEDTTNLYFTIPQLLKLTNIFLDLKPNGSLPTKTFIYIIEDIVVHHSDDGHNAILPLYWHRLEPTDVKDIIYQLYGTVEYVNWKDFIIFNLEIPFPTEKEVLDVRQQFREMDPDKLEYVNEVQFNMVRFWFENENLTFHYGKPTYTVKNIKNLLCKMFEIRENCINYSSLLLTFCKDENPIVGVAKALGLCIGKLICWNIQTGLNYLEILRYQKFLNEQKKDSSQAESNSTTALQVSETKFPSISDLNKEINNEFNEIPESQSFLLEEQSVEGEDIQFTPAPSLCYILPFHIILIIMTASLPWNIRVQCIQDKSLKEYLEIIYESVRNEEFQVVFAHDFLNTESFKEYLAQNRKFTVRSPAAIVQSKIEKCTCPKEDQSF